MTDRRRIALLIPSSNTVMENDLHHRLPKEKYTVHTGRMYLEETTAAAERVMLDEDAPAAATLVGTANPDLLVFGCTSAGSLGGVDYDRRFSDELGAKAGCPGIGVLSSIAESISRHQVQRVAVITPYIDELTNSVADGLAKQGLDVVTRAGMGIDVNVELATPTPEEITDFVLENIADAELDGIIISCTDFRALEAAEDIEQRTGLRVITSNSAVLEAVDRS